jgi:hypothetical protein
MSGPNPRRVHARTLAIYDVLLRIYEYADKYDLPTSVAANRLVEERLQTVSDLKAIHS